MLNTKVARCYVYVHIQNQYNLYLATKSSGSHDPAHHQDILVIVRLHLITLVMPTIHAWIAGKRGIADSELHARLTGCVMSCSTR